MAPLPQEEQQAPPPHEQEEDGAAMSSTNETNPNGTSEEGNNAPSSGSPYRKRLEDLGYGVESFHTIVRPVFATMILTAVAVTFLTTERSQRETTAALTRQYTVVRTTDDGAAAVGASLVNALIIVMAITIMTFVMVLLYKYRCMRVLKGYLMVAMCVLLLTLSAQMFDIAIERYQFTMDYVTFGILVYNFAAVGTVAIFWARGVPTYVTQAYLVLTSVFVAWQLAHFESYTAWALLALLALYDLYAVLSPYGPLQALVKLMQSPGAPPVPGLLYEAHVGGSGNHNNRRNATSPSERPSSRERPSRDEETTSGNSQRSPPTGEDHRSETSQPNMADTTSSSTATVSSRIRNEPDENNSPQTEATGGVGPGESPEEQRGSGPVDVDQTQESDDDNEPQHRASLGPVDVDHVTEAEAQQMASRNTGSRVVRSDESSYPRISIPLALAKLYRLPLDDDPQPPWLQPRAGQDPPRTYSVQELTSLVVAVAPRHGGTIRPHPEQIHDREIRYQVLDSTGQARRVLFVNATDGRVFEVHNYDQLVEDHRRSLNKRESIRLGLGDFIFYSVLVSKAALFSWTTFCAATLAILCGLGVTLLLLAWYAKALPALPVSIFLGVSFYLTTRHVLQPWVEHVFQEQIYV